MSRIAPHHAPGCGITGKCSIPMWSSGTPTGFCDNEAYGEQYAEGTSHAPGHWSRRDSNGFHLNPHNRPPYAPGFCCKQHGGPGADDIRFVRDGNMWCAFLPGFVNLQESDAGFGETQPAAEADLKAWMGRAKAGAL